MKPYLRQMKKVNTIDNTMSDGDPAHQGWKEYVLVNSLLQ